MGGFDWINIEEYITADFPTNFKPLGLSNYR